MIYNDFFIEFGESDISLFLSLAEQGLTRKEIEQKLLLKGDYFGQNFISFLISEMFPDLQIYAKSSKEKNSPTFLDLQYYLLAKKLLCLLYLRPRASWEGICKEFQFEDPNRFYTIGEKVLGINTNLKATLTPSFIESLIVKIIEKDPFLKLEIGRFMFEDKYIKIARNSGFRNPSDLTKIVFLGPILEKLLKEGGSSDDILDYFKYIDSTTGVTVTHFPIAELDRIANMIWRQLEGLEGARKIILYGKLDDGVKIRFTDSDI
ncbi:MAG: hypothetical protein GF353_02485 [Candidatus Lokiarchaeota archaeon]|nr:hypothetical protein [Candidatus Lokiarchaeota archaeon]